MDGIVSPCVASELAPSLPTMVRIKFTGPGSAALQMQSGPTTALYTLASESFAPAQPKSQHAIAQRPLLSQEEQQSLKQQQSLEMVQIMLHVSVSIIHLP